jgi:hypothetical protein
MSEALFPLPVRAHNTGQNLNTGILVVLIYETRIPVLIPVFQKQTVPTVPGRQPVGFCILSWQ